MHRRECGIQYEVEEFAHLDLGWRVRRMWRNGCRIIEACGREWGQSGVLQVQLNQKWSRDHRSLSGQRNVIDAYYKPDKIRQCFSKDKWSKIVTFKIKIIVKTVLFKDCVEIYNEYTLKTYFRNWLHSDRKNQ